jgi:hypothetical protein
MNISSFFEPVRIGTSINVLRNTTVLETYTNTNTNNNDNSNTDDRVCSICQNTYIEGAIIRKISHCNHFYHHHCLDQWLENNTKCPECQYDIRESIRPTTSTPNTSSATPQTQRQTPTQLSNNLEAEIDNFVTSLFQNRLSSGENIPPIISSVDILIPNSENGVTSRNLFRSSEQPRAPIFPQPQPPQPQHQQHQQPQPQPHPRPSYYYHPQPQAYYYQPYLYPQSFYEPPQSTLNERRMITSINRLERIVNQLQQQSRNQHQPRNQSRNNNQSRNHQPGN